ncbi:phosphatidylinositol-3,5-bisphosphate 5-phosphatase, partial [Teratosphaeriaceae sp. CCFEE 6253]
RRSVAADDARIASGDDDGGSRSRQPSLRSESAGSYEDGPTFPRVGATVEGLTGELDLDEANIHLTEPVAEAVDGASAAREPRPHRMYKFTLYETNARYWITGADVTDKAFRLLRIDRTSPPGHIVLFEDETIYDRRQMNE